tara:strand:- start:36 stop:245 length:210 start_codon:yes stop_codon:yes gene_type:complete
MAKQKTIFDMSIKELKSTLIDYKSSLFNLRFQKSLQQLEHPQKIRHLRRDIARVKTLIRKIELTSIDNK